jgi:glucose/arabinose dehydrogenase
MSKRIVFWCAALAVAAGLLVRGSSAAVFTSGRSSLEQASTPAATASALPPVELNRVTAAGQHFGYPSCHAGSVSDPEFGKDKPCANYVAPAQNLGPHVAAIGMRFHTGTLFPAEYRNQIFIAEQ